MTAPVRKRYAINCVEQCSFHPSKIGKRNAELLKEAREGGAGAVVFKRRAEALLKKTIPPSNVERHLRHYVELAEDEPEKPEGPRPSDLAILDAIIVQGYRNSRNWKPTIKDTLDAMKLKVSMTGQSAFEDMIAAMNAALDMDEEITDEEEEAEAPENPAAVLSDGELAFEEDEEAE